MKRFTYALESFQLDCKILQIMFFYRSDNHSVPKYTICDIRTVDTQNNITILLRDLQILAWRQHPIEEINFEEYLNKYSSEQYGNRIYILVDSSTVKWQFDQNEFEEKKLYQEKLGVFARSTRSTKNHLIYYYNLHE